MNIEEVMATSIFASFPHSGGHINWNYTDITFLRFSYFGEALRCFVAFLASRLFA